jgi:hypothetical protein
MRTEELKTRVPHLGDDSPIGDRFGVGDGVVAQITSGWVDGMRGWRIECFQSFRSVVIHGKPGFDLTDFLGEQLC